TARAKAVLSSPEIKLLAGSPPSERAEGPCPGAVSRLASGSCRGPRTRRTPTRVPQQPERPVALPRPPVGARGCRTRKLLASRAASVPARSEVPDAAGVGPGEHKSPAGRGGRGWSPP